MDVSAGELCSGGVSSGGGRYTETVGVGSKTQHLDGGGNITCSLLSVSTRYTASTRENVRYRRQSCDKQATRY